MPTTENPHKRSEPRVLYRAPVWLRAAGEDASLIGETRNLSRRGMFVSVAPTLPLGQAVVCELPGRREVHGRVAWVFEARSPEASELTGVGIEFVDLSSDGVSSGATIIESLTGMRLDEAQPVNVWFDGLPSPTRSVAEVTHAGIELSTTLEFLRIGSEVEVAPVGSSDPARLHGRIARVELHTHDGSPRLAISVAVLPERAPLGLEPEDERWFPDIVVDAPPVIAFAAEVAEVAEQAVRPSLAEIEAEIAARLDAEVALEAASVKSVEVERTERTRTAPPSVVTSRSHRLGLGVLLGVVAASALVLRVGFPAGEQPAALPSLPPAAPLVAPVPEEIAAAPVAVVATAPHGPSPAVAVATAPTSRSVPVEATAPAPRLEPTRPAPSKPGLAGSSPWKPELITTGDMQSVVVPIAGSAKGLSRYLLDDPPGVAVDLPAARGAVPLKPYPLHDASFQSLWVRTRPQGGLQIRLHVQKGVRVTVEPVDGGLRFRRVE